MVFSDIVESIKSLSLEEKQEVQLLLGQYLREERREEIYASLKRSQDEEQQGALVFSRNINDLRALIEE
jgi:hypothetical protein